MLSTHEGLYVLQHKRRPGRCHEALKANRGPGNGYTTKRLGPRGAVRGEVS